MTLIADQYRIIEAGAGWIDRSSRGRLEFVGTDARAFLQALLTNDLDARTSGQGVDAAYLTPQGRMIAMLRVLLCEDRVLVEVAPGQSDALARRFDHAIFSEQVRVTDISAATTAIGVTGGAAAGVVASALGVGVDRLTSLGALGHLAIGDALIVRTDDGELPGFEVIAPAASYGAIVEKLESAGAIAIDPALDSALRIDAARPAFGIDMTEDTIPLEAGLLERAISTTKGCYVGQEVIIRVLHRGGGRVAKRLVRLSFDPSVTSAPAIGSILLAGGAETGRVTSAAISPRRGHVIALGYVHRDAATIGTPVVARTNDGDLSAVIDGFAR